MADISINYSIDDENKDSVLMRMQKDLNFYLNNLDHANVKRLYTDYCDIQSEDGSTILEGALLKMYKSGSSTLRLKMGYNDSSNNFEFVLYDKNGTPTIYLNSNGQAVFEGILATTISASDITTGTLSGVTISGNTILGGSISIGGRFTVNSNGYMTCTGASISGTLTSSTISGGSISGASISGGSLSIGGRFTVNSNGYMSCTGASIRGTLTSSSVSSSTISGGSISGASISGGSLSIGSNFYVNTSGYLTTYSASLFGTLKTGSGSTYSELGASGLRNYYNGALNGLITSGSNTMVDFYNRGRSYMSIYSSTSGSVDLYQNGWGDIISAYAQEKSFSGSVNFSACTVYGLTTTNMTYSSLYQGHNHGISHGTKLLVSGGGTVTWAESGGHYHSVG